MAYSLAICAVVLLMVISLFVVPVVLMFRTESAHLLRLWRGDEDRFITQCGWRKHLQRLAIWLSMISTFIGRLAAWLVLFMTLMQFIVVIMRYVFSYGSIQMQESIWYMHGLLFMLGAAYTLVKDGHVRLDVFYRDARERTKAWINLAGSVIILLPFCIVNFDNVWIFVSNSWAVREGSAEATGLPYLYLFKSVILIFFILLVIEGISLAIKSLLTLCSRTLPKPEPDSS